MGENKLLVISGDDWEGVYHDGLLVTEGHSIQREELIEIMRNYETLDVEFQTLTEDGIEWLHEEGSLPEYITEIPSQYKEL